MAQITNGIRSILSLPWAYNLWAFAIGSGKARQDFIDNYLCLESDSKVFDIGCGTGELVEFLPEGTQYTGFDLSKKYVDAAREKFGDRASFVHAYVGSTPEIEEGTYDIALATGVLHHLEDSEAVELFQLAHRALKPGGRLVTVDGVYTEGQSRIARYLISRDRGRNVRTRNGYLDLAKGVFDELEDDVRNDFIRIPYTHLILTCTK